MLPQLSLRENITVTISRRLGVAGFILPDKQHHEADRLVRSFSVTAASIEQPIAELSGGNQQKAVFGRALASDPRVLVLVHPTQGVDIASKVALFNIVDKAREAGAAVLLVSDDLDELFVCSRLLVIFKGRLAKEFGTDWKDDKVVAAIEGWRRMSSESNVGGTQRIAGVAWRSLSGWVGELTLLPIIAVAVVVGMLTSHEFLTTGNIINILQHSSELSILVIAEVNALSLQGILIYRSSQ